MNNKETTKAAHNAIAEKYYELYNDDVTDLKYFDCFLDDCKIKILELGCGMGHYSNYMCNKGFDVTGIDFSEGMIDIANRNNVGVRFLCHDICDLSIIKGEKFDGIVLAYVLQHLSKEEVNSVFESLNNHLNKDARLLMFLREGDNIVEEEEPINTKYKYVINEYSKSEITNLLKQHGWQVKFIETKDYVEDPNSLAPTTLVVMANKI